MATPTENRVLEGAGRLLVFRQETLFISGHASAGYYGERISAAFCGPLSKLALMRSRAQMSSSRPLR